MLKFVFLPTARHMQPDWLPRMREALPQYDVTLAETEAEARREIVDADAAYGWVSPDLLPLASKLRWLQNPDSGPFTGYFYQELIDHPVIVCNPRGIYSDHITQHIMMFVLGLSRGLPYFSEAQRRRDWDPDTGKNAHIDLANATALINGVGGVGHETAKACSAFGMRVIGVDPRWEFEEEVPFVEKHQPEDLDDLLPRADFVITTTPHTPNTEGMWNRKRFRLMKKTAYFINTGRGMTTKLDDLTTAIEDGEIAGCGLDVYEIEPLPPDHKLWQLPNVILTPHVAVMNADNVLERRFQIILDNARRFAASEPLRNVVDKAAWY